MTFQNSLEEPWECSLSKNSQGKRMNIIEIDIMFHVLLREVWKFNLSLILNVVNLANLYSVCRLLRQGAILEALNANILEDVVNANN